MTIKVLDKSTIQNLHSGQVIVDLEAIVKELVENSLDANATTIDFIFMNNGLESIQVKDDGDGIAENDRLCIAKRHHTSKIQAFHDLETVQTYGFRGEAMNSICSISDRFTIMTKTKEDTIGKQYNIDKDGNISNEKSINTIPKSGTIITLYKPFYNLPVRRQLAMKNASNNMKKIQELLVKYALVHPNVRFSSQLVKNTASSSRKDMNNNMWIKPITSSIESTMVMLFGAPLTDMLEHFLETDLDHPTLSVDVVLPKPNSDPSIVLKGPDRIYIYVNDRPINYVKSELKDLITTIRNRYRNTIGLTESTSKKTPFIYMNIKISPDEYDVNIEPNKTTILFHNKKLIFNLVETKILDKTYPTNLDRFFQPTNDKPPTITIPNDEENIMPSSSGEQPTGATNLIPSAPTPTVDKNDINNMLGNDWSFNMDDEEIDQLSESDDEQCIKNVPTTATVVNNLVSNMVNEPADMGVVGANNNNLTSHVTKPQLTTRPSLSEASSSNTNNKHPTPPTHSIFNPINHALPQQRRNPTTETPNSIIPKKRNIERIDDGECGIYTPGAAAPHFNTLKAQTTLISPNMYSGAPQKNVTPHVHRANTPAALATARIHCDTSPSHMIMAPPPFVASPIPPPPVISSSIRSTLPSRASPLIANMVHPTAVNADREKEAALLNQQKQRAVPPYRNPTSAIKLRDTLNKTMTIKCSLEDIKASYPRRREILSKTYRVSIDEYLSATDTTNNSDDKDGQITSLIKFPSGTAAHNQLSFYTRGKMSTLDSGYRRHELFQLGVVKLKSLYVDTTVARLLQEHRLVCKKPFDRPVQIQMNHQDHLCPVLISLKSKEQFVNDDLHGQKKISYSEIMDDTIINNGFKVRWRKDLYSGNLVIQFTSIYSLGSGYGPSDFRELLSLMMKSKPGEFVRPKKVVDHIRSIAEQIYNYSSKESCEYAVSDLGKVLSDLKWDRDQQESDWELGYGYNTNKVIACMLTGHHQ